MDHTIDKCYKIHGFPIYFNFNKTPPRRTDVHIELATSGQKGSYTRDDDSSTNQITHNLIIFLDCLRQNIIRYLCC